MPALTLSRAGTVLPLTEPNGWSILPGVQGLDDPPRALIEVEPATGDGSLVMDARYQAREVFLPLHYAAPDKDTGTLRATLRGLAALCDVKAGSSVTLDVAHTDGSRRLIDGLLAQPYAQTVTSGEGALWRTIGLTLRCPDPFFYSETRQAGWTLGGEPRPFLGDTFLPVQLDNSQVLGAAIIDNPGDAHAYPVWTLTGPCDTVTVTTGDTTWTVPAGLTDAETLVIDARRGVKTCQINGVSAWGRLAPGSVIATLAPGDNLLDFEAVGATAATTISVRWAERWLTAW
jgi:phage-related protein